MSKGGLTNQIYLYSLETKNFYTDEELRLNDLYFKAIRVKKKAKEKYEKYSKNFKKLEENDEKLIEKYSKAIKIYKQRIKNISSILNTYKTLLNEEIASFPSDSLRTLNRDSLKINNKVGLFESSLTRTCKFKTDQVTEELFIIRVFHYDILKSIIDNGFNFEGEKYMYFTSSAGQIRTKKIVAIKESLYRKHEMTITCGLPVESINARGGINTNKYQAYLALANSASQVWKRFNIDRVIVVDDMETLVRSEVDYIDKEDFSITRKEMDIPIEHMDGCGIVLPSVSKSSYMFRMPWMKGMLTPVDFVKFINKYNASTKIKDIYGKEYDIIEDGINIILTKSQFKMWKFYDSWDDYKEKFKKYNSEACKFNVEDIGSKATINYQMLQTLTSMTEEELVTIAQESIKDIYNIGSDKEVMLRSLGAFKENRNMNAFQKSLLLYNELLSDSHSREVIKSKKRSMVRDGRSGKIRVNGHYTFIIPDLYAFCEWLFLGSKEPKGILKNKEVHCKIHNEGEVDVLRAPHLYREHAIRDNTYNEEIEEWFITKGVYTSIHDPISKILQFDK